MVRFIKLQKFVLGRSEKTSLILPINKIISIDRNNVGKFCYTRIKMINGYSYGVWETPEQVQEILNEEDQNEFCKKK